MLGNTLIVTDFDAGRIDKANATTLTKTVLEIDTQGHQTGGEPVNKTLIAREPWKFATPVATDVLLIKMLKITIRLLVEAHQNRHDFTQAHRPSTLAMAQSIADERSLPLGLKGLAKVIDVTKQLF